MSLRELAPAYPAQESQAPAGRVALREHQRSLILVSLATGFLYLVFVALCVRPYHGNLSSLIEMGQSKYDARAVGHHVVIFRNRIFDGQLYYYVANDLFLQHPAADTRLFDRRDTSFAPNFHQRIGYPLLFSAVSLGNREWRPAAMVGVNLAMVVIVAYLSGIIILLLGQGTSPWWALACAVNPSLLIGVQYDVAEPMAFALALAGLVLYLRRRIALATLVFAMALLTREITLLFLIPILAAELGARRWRSILLLCTSVIPYLAYQSILTRAFGRPGVVKGNFGMPLAGMRDIAGVALRSSLRSAVAHEGVLLVMAIICVAALLLGVQEVWRRYDVAAGGMLVHGFAALFASISVWGYYTSVARVFGGVYLFAIFAYARHRSLGLRLLVGAILLLSAITFLRSAVFVPTYPYFVTP